jgi:hypothetical protein
MPCAGTNPPQGLCWQNLAVVGRRRWADPDPRHVTVGRAMRRGVESSSCCAVLDRHPVQQRPGHVMSLLPAGLDGAPPVSGTTSSATSPPSSRSAKQRSTERQCKPCLPSCFWYGGSALAQLPAVGPEEQRLDNDAMRHCVSRLDSLSRRRRAPGPNRSSLPGKGE